MSLITKIVQPAASQRDVASSNNLEAAEIITRPERDPQDNKRLSVQQQVKHFLTVWLGDAVVPVPEDNADVRFNKSKLLNSYYRDLFGIGAVAIEKEKLRMTSIRR